MRPYLGSTFEAAQTRLRIHFVKLIQIYAERILNYFNFPAINSMFSKH